MQGRQSGLKTGGVVGSGLKTGGAVGFGFKTRCVAGSINSTDGGT